MRPGLYSANLETCLFVRCQASVVTNCDLRIAIYALSKERERRAQASDHGQLTSKDCLV